MLKTDRSTLRVRKNITSRKLWPVSDGSPEFTAGRATVASGVGGHGQREVVYLQTLRFSRTADVMQSFTDGFVYALFPSAGRRGTSSPGVWFAFIFYVTLTPAKSQKRSLPHSNLARRHYVFLHLEIALLHTIMKVTTEILSNTLSARKRLGDTEMRKEAYYEMPLVVVAVGCNSVDRPP